MKINLPYFDLLLEDRRRGGTAGEIFGDFVHWGYWDKPSAATGSHEDFLSAMSRMNDQILDLVDLHPGQRVLDVGCGFGGTLAAIDRRLGDVCLTGINIDARQLEAAKSSVTVAPASSIHFIAGDACRLPFPDASFDRVVAVESAFHFPSRQSFLNEAARVLKPTGKLALSDFVPQMASAGPIGRWLQRQVETGYGNSESAWPDGRYEKMAERAGFFCFRNWDVTPHTLPTYPFIRNLLNRANIARPGRPMAKATSLLEWLSRLRFVRYRIFAFYRTPAATLGP